MNPVERLLSSLGFNCDRTYEINFILPGADEHFSGSSPKTVKVDLEVWAGTCLHPPPYINQQRTSGTLSVNGVEVKSWNESKPSSHPFRLDFQVPITTGVNIIEARSANEKVVESLTVYLDP